jgi:indolepyruvate ferredoxin oxidoreductase
MAGTSPAMTVPAFGPAILELPAAMQYSIRHGQFGEKRLDLAQVNLEDKYTLQSGRIYLSGIQALVRLPLMQRARDRAAGLNTAGFISGYRGSPLGAYDSALWQAKTLLEQNDIRFQPGLNEDLAATAVWGSQQVGLFPGATVDGVFGIWYGKGPGVDRSMDPLRHANWAGTSPHGGVLAIAGDDHGAQSTTTAYQCEQMFEAAMMPILNPATIQDFLDFGLFGLALSRFSGCWVAFKATSEAVDSSATVSVDPQRAAVTMPDFAVPPSGLHIRWPRAGLDWAVEQERRLHGPKLNAVAAFARANGIDRIAIDAPQPRLGIITTGKAYLDVRQALFELGISEQQAAALGIRIYKVGLTWPLESQRALAFAQGLNDVLVVEEKRGFVENQLVRLLYNVDASRRPSVVGKTDESGALLLPSTGELTPTVVARAIVTRLRRLGETQFDERLARLESFERPAPPVSTIQRTPFFCSGCPHNTSTRVPEGSRAMAGIGCHSMALFMPDRHTAMLTHMGGEGVNWIGQAPFTSERHVFQNLGDGTYAHSGLTAIRAAAAAGINITYKILYNDAVAMTGGQPVEGALTVPQIARQVAAEGAQRIAVVADELGKYGRDSGFPSGTTIHHRDDLDSVQRELRDIAGLTVLIYDQTCAAEKRRRRKRGRFPDPPERVFINDAVCEGCGDCSDKSNCIAVVPVETEFGRKRRIDQSSCNKDFSCLKGFCPSFVTVRGATPRKLGALAGNDALFAGLPEPQTPALQRPYSILITGIGGTGVVTLSALLGMAAHLEGKGATVLDISGLAQKNGAVMSHVRLAPQPDDLYAVRVAAGSADVLLACDPVVAGSPAALARVQGSTKAVVNSHAAPTAAFIAKPDIDFETAKMLQAIKTAAGEADLIDATALAAALMGDSIAANLFILGYAFQKGLIPLSLAAIARAIELNGVAVDANKRSFAWGRLAAADRAKVEALVRNTLADDSTPQPQGLDALIERRAAFLTDYQSAAYARRYRDAVATIRAAEEKNARGFTSLAEAVARNLFSLMAYKDEYEVARLYTDSAFLKKLQRQFEGDFTLEYHLAPPLLAQRDPTTGEPKKRAFGPWMGKMFKLLAWLRPLRGTALDIFGYTQERRMERRLIADYEAVLRELAASLTPDNQALAVEIASLPVKIRGFGHVKAKNVETAKACQAELLALWRSKNAPAVAA